MLRGGSIEEPVFYKSLVGLAYEFTQIDCLDEALFLLNSIPAGYFADTMGKQMAEDPNFKVVSAVLAKRLQQEGLVGHKESPLPAGFFVQKPGKA